MGSLRSMGYSFESAVADVVDNSISAHAQNVRILFPTNPMDELALGILDDGDGMAADVLFEAMRYGCLSAEEERSEDDLGRFGMGMKSASLSQCRCLTVVSYEGKKLNGFTWDYNHILDSGLDDKGIGFQRNRCTTVYCKTKRAKEWNIGHLARF